MIYKLSDGCASCYVISPYVKPEFVIRFTPGVKDYFEDEPDWASQVSVSKIDPKHPLTINLMPESKQIEITHTCEEWEAIYREEPGIICQSEY